MSFNVFSLYLLKYPSLFGIRAEYLSHQGALKYHGRLNSQQAQHGISIAMEGEKTVNARWR